MPVTSRELIRFYGKGSCARCGLDLTTLSSFQSGNSIVIIVEGTLGILASLFNCVKEDTGSR